MLACPPTAIHAPMPRRAAEQGHARAQYNLGGMYDQGLAVPQDVAEAHTWLTIAAQRHGTRGFDYCSRALGRPVTGDCEPGTPLGA